jgi:hypothetical protein
MTQMDAVKANIQECHDGLMRYKGEMIYKLRQKLTLKQPKPNVCGVEIQRELITPGRTQYSTRLATDNSNPAMLEKISSPCDRQLRLVVVPGGSLSGGGRGTHWTTRRIALSAERASTLRWISSVDSLQSISRIGEHLFAVATTQIEGGCRERSSAE